MLRESDNAAFREECLLHLTDHRLADLALPVLGSLETVHVELVVHQRLSHLFRRTEDKWSVLDHLLVEDLPGNENKLRAFRRVLGYLDNYDIAFGLEYAVVILGDCLFAGASPEYCGAF